MNTKFCLTSQCDKKYLSQAHEIRLAPNDDVFDYIEKYPKTNLIIPYPITTAPIEELKRYSKLGRICLAITDFSCLKEIAGIPWFYDIPVRTFFELQNLVKLGSTYIVIDGPLFNQMSKVEEILTPEQNLRLAPNVAYYAYIPAKNGVIGSWVRPEDTASLQTYPIVYEFGDCEDRPRKEEALFRVYSSGEWQGDLSNIITNLNFTADNQLISPEMIEKRISCGQRCQSGNSCRLCYRYLQIANKDFINKIKGQKEE